MKEKFEEHRFRADAQILLGKINAILADYQRQGYTLSLRQLYYQLVSRDIVENNLRSYKNVGNLVSDGRLAGLIDWAAIEDRGRDYVLPSHWGSPDEIVRAAAQGYAIDKWVDQPIHVEVMCEKDALSGVLEPVCRDLDVGFSANRGYSSSSALYYAGKRMAKARRSGKGNLILYFGDHDPSGMDMTRDVRERLELFSRGPIKTVRMALNMDQVEQYNPPENPAKTTDSRAADYIAQFGESSWELDALEPAVLSELVRSAVAEVRDDDLYQLRLDKEDGERHGLELISNNYEDVKKFVEEL